MNVSKLKIKVCGMREKENLRQLAELNPDFIGFIFYNKSPRFVGEDFDPSFTAIVPDYIEKVGVFVNAEFDYILNKVSRYGLTHVQLHGDEDISYCRKLSENGIQIIKSFSIGENFNFDSLNDYKDCCNYFLFDTKTPTHGGSGIKFNWNLLEKKNIQKPFFLSGGIGPEDIENLQALNGMPVFALDINSKFEISPALKDIHILRTFINNIRTEI